MALAAAGRPVPLSTLSRLGASMAAAAARQLWHRRGPRLITGASLDILARAIAVFDLLGRHGQVDLVLWGLWLRGYFVPAVRLRRVWQQYCRTRRRWLPVPASAQEAGQVMPGVPNPFSLRRHACSAIRCRRTAASVPSSRGPRRGWNAAANILTNSSGGQLWPLLQFAGMALESSALIETASDERLLGAQHYLCAAGALIGRCAVELDAKQTNAWTAHPWSTDPWNDDIAERVGPPLALVILALICSGQEAVLADLARLEAPDSPMAPVHRASRQPQRIMA